MAYQLKTAKARRLMSGSRGIGGPAGYFGVPLVAGVRTQTAIDVGANNSDADDNSRAANVAQTIIDATAACTETIAATAVDDDMKGRRRHR